MRDGNNLSIRCRRRQATLVVRVLWISRASNVVALSAYVGIGGVMKTKYTVSNGEIYFDELEAEVARLKARLTELREAVVWHHECLDFWQWCDYGRYWLTGPASKEMFYSLVVAERILQQLAGVKPEKIIACPFPRASWSCRRWTWTIRKNTATPSRTRRPSPRTTD